MKKREVWTIFVNKADPTAFCFQNHLGNFLSADQDGKVTTTPSPVDNEYFLLTFSESQVGEVTIKSKNHSYYLHASDVGVSCFSKAPVGWGYRIACYPQVHLHSLARSRYLRVLEDNQELRCDLSLPWSSSALFWLELQPVPTTNQRAPCGQEEVAKRSFLSIRTQEGRYLNQDGGLEDSVSSKTLFAMEFRPGPIANVAFRHASGGYLSVYGQGMLKLKQLQTPGRDELFVLERATPHVQLQAQNGKYVSIKQGSELTANQSEAAAETCSFQLEYVGGKGFDASELVQYTMAPSAEGCESPTASPQSATNGMHPEAYFLVTGNWKLRSFNGQLWTLVPGAAAMIGDAKGAKNDFELLSPVEKKLGDVVRYGGAILRIKSGQLVETKMLGAVTLGRIISMDEAPNPCELFHIRPFTNRPSLTLFSVHSGGYLAYSLVGKASARYEVECSNTTAQQLFLRHLPNNAFQLFIEHQSGSTKWAFLTIERDALTVKSSDFGLDDATEAAQENSEFVFYFLGNNRILVRSILADKPGLALLHTTNKGSMTLNTSGEISAGSIWEL